MKAQDSFACYLTDNGREFLALRLTGIGFEAAMEEMRRRRFLGSWGKWFQTARTPGCQRHEEEKR